MSEKNKQKVKRSFLQRFFRNEEGVVAIEFGAIALPFFLIIVGSLEIAIVFLATMTLDSGMHQAARFVQTGQAKTANLTETQFKQMVCDGAVMLPNCMSGIKVDVRKYSKFTDATFPEMVKPNGEPLEDQDYQYDIGKAESTVVVRVSYVWPILSSVINSGMGNLPSGDRLLIASWAFKNEPF